MIFERSQYRVAACPVTTTTGRARDFNAAPATRHTIGIPSNAATAFVVAAPWAKRVDRPAARMSAAIGSRRFFKAQRFLPLRCDYFGNDRDGDFGRTARTDVEPYGCMDTRKRGLWNVLRSKTIQPSCIGFA